jgi:hypothetical protein
MAHDEVTVTTRDGREFVVQYDVTPGHSGSATEPPIGMHLELIEAYDALGDPATEDLDDATIDELMAGAEAQEEDRETHAERDVDESISEGYMARGWA